MVISPKKPKKVTEGGEMTLKEANIRYNLLNIIAEPKNCTKTDVHLYKNETGRVNFWYKREDSANLDILSYYFTYSNNELKVYDDKKLVNSLKI